MKYVVRTFNPEQCVAYEANNYHDIINEFKENNKDLKVGAIYKQDNIVQCNVYSANNLFIDMLEITMQ